jgi:hypothetical protein
MLGPCLAYLHLGKVSGSGCTSHDLLKVRVRFPAFNRGWVRFPSSVKRRKDISVIHKSPEEALNLSLFDPELRPYLKKIFLDKYPNVVSLHS